MDILMRLLATSLLLASHAHAQDSEEEELQALLALLDEETEIATKTRLNADYVPGVVTVLRGDDLAALGARHVLDGLAQVPGIQALRDDLGNATLRVRGIDFYENSGQVKILVNGVSYARESAGQNGSILLIPIEHVDRIEVIRGPGSEVYGDFAFAGLINIITRDEGNGVYLQAGGGGLRTAGVSLNHGRQSDDFRVSFGLSRYDADALEAANRTRVATEERYFGHLNIQYKDLSFKLSGVDRSALHSGARDALRPREEQGIAAELRYRWGLSIADVQMESWLNYADNDMENNGTLFFEGGRQEIGTSANWRTEVHHLVAQVSYGERDYESVILAPPGLPGPPRPPRIGSDQNRNLASASIQDQIDLTPVTLTIGARYDWLEGIDQRVTPRLAAVWRIDERHALKSQYTEGFRSGTAANESASGRINDQLDFEVMKTLEAQYIYRRPESAFKATLYTARLEDRIQVVPSAPGGPPAGFRNFGTIDAQGLELEWWRQFGTKWRVIANLSFQDTDVEGSTPPLVDGPSFAQAELLANLGVIARPWDEWTFGLHLNHVGEREVLDGAKIDGYNELNFSATYAPLWAAGLKMRLTAKNAGKEEVTYAFFLPPGNVRTLDYDQRRIAFEVLWGW